LAANPLRTRADLQAALLELWRPLRPFFAAAPAAPDIGSTAATYGARVAMLETFARPLWGIAPFVAGGGEFPDWELYHRGVDAGTDPAHPDFWGNLGDTDQRAVEMAAIGFALALCPLQFWDPLAQPVRDRLAAWLGQINRRKLVGNNWLFFRVLVNAGLEAAGQPADEAQVARDLDAVERFYLGKGWFSDGVGGNRDYYIPMAIYFYGLIYTRLSAGGDQTRTARLAERARLFAPQFAAWFDAEGAALPFGRSLAYRFAQGAFWGGLAYAGIEALPWGQIKGLHLRHLRWWFRQPMFTETGLLSIGYVYPNLAMADRYNAPGSPYWALKALLPLALPESHPFWRATESPTPVRAVVAQPEASLILCQDKDGRHLFALGGLNAPGWDPRHGAEKYAKCTYSTVFGFGVAFGGDGPEGGAGDGALLLSDDGQHWRGRERGERGTVAPDGAFLEVRWKPWPDVVVDTWLVPGLPGHVRVHRVQSPRPLQSFEGGFALDRFRERPARRSGASFAEASHSQAFSGLRDLVGTRSGVVLETSPNSNVVSPLCVLPGLRGDHPVGETWLFGAVLAAPGVAAPAWLETFVSEWQVADVNGERRLLRGGKTIFVCPLH
jgi:hypothetical protein